MNGTKEMNPHRKTFRCLVSYHARIVLGAASFVQQASKPSDVLTKGRELSGTIVMSMCDE